MKKLTEKQRTELTTKYGTVAMHAYDLICNEIEATYAKEDEQTPNQYQAECEQIAKRIVNQA